MIKPQNGISTGRVFEKAQASIALHASRVQRCPWVRLTLGRNRAAARVEYAQVSPSAEVPPDEAQQFYSAFFTKSSLFPTSANAQAWSRRVQTHARGYNGPRRLQPRLAAEPGWARGTCVANPRGALEYHPLRLVDSSQNTKNYIKLIAKKLKTHMYFFQNAFFLVLTQNVFVIFCKNYRFWRKLLLKSGQLAFQKKYKSFFVDPNCAKRKVAKAYFRGSQK